VPDGAEVRAGTDPLDPADDQVLGGGGLCGCHGAGSAAPWALAALLVWARARRRPRAPTPAPARVVTPAPELLGALLAAALWAAPARAESVDIQQFKPAPGAGAMLTLHGVRPLGHLTSQFGLVATYASAPLVLRTVMSGANQAVVSSQATADVLAAIGLLDRLELGLALPVTVQGSAPAPILGQEFSGGVAPVAIGDLRVVPKGSILELSGFRLGVAATFTIPTGSATALTGQGGLSARPRLLAEYELQDRARFALNLGANLRRPAQLLNLTVGSELAAAAAAEVKVMESLSVAGGLSGALGLAESRPEDRPLEMLAEARYALGGGMSTTFGAGLGLTRGYGTPLFRVMAGFSWSQRAGVGGEERDPFGSTPSPPPPVKVAAKAAALPLPPPPPPPPPKRAIKDADQDGVADELDLCPDDPGPGDPDGCPPDDDRDGIPNARDRCPTQPEKLNGVEDDDGCPEGSPGKAAPKNVPKKKKRPGRRR